MSDDDDDDDTSKATTIVDSSNGNGNGNGNSLEEVVSLLASCSLDSASRTQRVDVVAKALELIHSDHGAGLSQLLTVPLCTSTHATKRVVELYRKALKEANSDDAAPALDNKEAIVMSLCKGLCNILLANANGTTTGKLVMECSQSMAATETTTTASLLKLAQDDANIVAITLGFMTSTNTNKKEWLDLFLTHTLDTTIATPHEMRLCLGITSNLSQSDWDDCVAPLVSQKVKAAPEKVLETVAALMEAVSNGNTNATIPKPPNDDMTTALTKQLKSTKDSMRTAAISILTNMALSNVAVTTMATALPTLLLHREGIYKALSTIATAKGNDATTEHADTILSSLTTSLGKETAKTATAARDAGITALVQWMAIAKRAGSAGKGFTAAVAYLRKPLEAGTDAVQRMGVLFRETNADVQESIVLDLFNGSAAKVEKGLQIIVDNAAKKSTTVASTEGLVAIHIVLLQALGSGKYNSLKPAFQQLLSAGSATLAKTSFLYNKPLTDALETNPLVRQLLPRTIALYVKLMAKQDKPESSSMLSKSSSAATHAMACCIAHPMTTTAILSCVQTIFTYDAKATLIGALFQHVNATGIEMEDRVAAMAESRQAREAFAPYEESVTLVTAKNGGGAASLDASAIRQVARKLAEKCSTSPTNLTKTWLLMHVMTTKRLGNKKQRGGLTVGILQLVKDIVLQWQGDDEKLKEMADFLSKYACDLKVAGKEDGTVVSSVMHEAATSLIASLGSIASSFDPSMDDPEEEEMKPHVVARKLCADELANSFKTKLFTSLNSVEALTNEEVDLYKTNIGTFYTEKPLVDDNDAKVTNADKKKSGGRRGKGGSTFEDEEWERQMKKELAAKKKKQADGGSVAQTLTAAQKKQVVQQDVDRKRMKDLVDGNYLRALNSIKALCLSDIEVGNACLPVLGEIVVLASISKAPILTRVPRLSSANRDTLTALATCVYEIDEDFSHEMARALVGSCKWKAASKSDEGSSSSFSVVALPSKCEPVGSVITEMDDYGDCLAGSSFSFLFPVVRAALTGPRTTAGAEGALRVLERHTSMLVGDEVDASVKSLRKDMAATVLELLSHDRSQTFTNPSAYDALVACYVTDAETKGPALTTAELAPLLGERGALGSRNCRVGAMKALESVAANHPKLVKNNPLVENRIWVNCFATDENIQAAARTAWQTVSGASGDVLPPPSIMYAIPLLPLLSHDDITIAHAAAVANAAAMGHHPKSVDRNLQKLCTTYIDSYATGGNGGKKSAGPLAMPAALPLKKPVIAAPPPIKKKPIATGLPKKKSKKDALSIMGKPKTGGRSKTGPKKTALHSALLKPKEVRTFDHDVLASQFKTAESKEESVEKDTPEKIAIRSGMLSAIAAITGKTAKVSLEIPTVKLLAGFLLAYGLADDNDDVRGAARNALRDVVATFGSSDEAIVFLLPLLEGVLSTGEPHEESLGSLSVKLIPRNVVAADRRKEGAVMALGSVALHLKGEENEQKIDATIDMLISTLSTPTESVQSSVADCLAKLMKKGKTQTRLETILKDLLSDCLYGDTQDTRRGAAYGISAAVKGSGIASLKKFEVVKRLEEACDSGSQSNKEGSLFAIELLSARLGLLFEPYVIVLLPSLLKSFSDSSDHVRSAAANTAGLIMSKLSAHGVKLVMPAVLTAFNDPAWRTKQASIQMLGSMSHLAPKQLASALPKVVPKLTEAFSDTHPKVKISAQEALDELSKVIKNPEISSISATLLTALTDPSEGTIRALESLIETEFLHAIDAPSLALIVPILHRGLRDRVATTKRYGALIAGNICTMINDPKDFLPYLPILLPDLQLAILDPIPDVRSTSAKAVGSLTRSLGEDSLPDLRTWLIEKLRDEKVMSAERSGAAQGLTELLVAGGAEVVEDVMREEILPLRSHPSASTREGVLWVLTFLPSSLGQSFTPLIDISLPALIGGLSDDSEPVRDVAMRAGRVLIRSHGKAHVNKILPALEQGLSDEDYRIRVASLTLLGDLLSMIGGTSVIKGDGETQDDIRKAERAQAQIALALGAETRKRVLSGLYLARSDTTTVVRQSAVQVWKTVVSVTARSLRDILPVLVSQIVDALASGHPERTQVAGRCLGDIVNKLGDSVLPEIIPVLRNALYDGDRHTKRGVCVGLSEVISCSTREQILKFIEIIVKVVQDALCDEDDGVREMAASCFQSLHNVVGSRAFDEIVPSLLVALDYGDDENDARSRALNGLTGILSIRSRELLPYIIPRLIKSPISANHAQALSGIADVTGSTLHMHFSAIIPAIILELSQIGSDDEEKERESAIRDSARSISRNVDESGVNWLISEIASKCGSDKPEIRKASCWMFQTFAEERKEQADFYEQCPIILRELLYRFNDEDAGVLKANKEALGALTKSVPAEDLVMHIEFIRNLIMSMVSDARRRKGGVGDGEFLMPGFNIPKGLEPLLPIYQRGILYGTPTIREVSASGLGELISLTASKFLAGQLIIKMTGPLLRIVGDRNPAEVKVAILRTLGLILVKGGPALRAFVPQFQTTFVKALSDPSRQVRVEAIAALGLLMPLSTRVDPLLKELVTGSLGKSSAETGAVAAVQTATLDALTVVLKDGGKKAKLPDSIPSALNAGKELLKHEDEGVRESAAKVVGATCLLLGLEIAIETIQEVILSDDGEDSDIRHGKACASQRIMASVGSTLPDDVSDKVTKLIVSYTTDDKALVKESAAVALGAVAGSAADATARLREVESIFLNIMKSSSERMEMHQAVARGLCIALSLADVEDKVAFFGKNLLDACLQLAMSGTQRVQYAFNDVLWLALNVSEGDEGLEAYVSIANFDNSKSMKSLYTKILSRTKSVTVDV